MKRPVTGILCLVVFLAVCGQIAEKEIQHDVLPREGIVQLGAEGLHGVAHIDEDQASALPSMLAHEGRDLAHAQAVVWHPNPRLIGVAATAYRFSVFEGTVKVDPLLWIYLYGHEGDGTVLAVGTITDTAPKILAAGEIALPNVDDWDTIGEAWRFDLSEQNAGPHMQLATFTVGDRQEPVWLSEPVVGFKSQLRTGEEGLLVPTKSLYLGNLVIDTSHVVALNARSGERLTEREAILSIVDQRSSRTLPLTNLAPEGEENMEYTFLEEGESVVKLFNPFYFAFEEKGGRRKAR